MKTAGLAILAAAVLVGLPHPAGACSVGPGYLMPSNFELVRDADGVVLAQVIRFIKKDDYVVQVEFDVLQVLKGKVEGKTLTLEGNDRWLGPSVPEDFSRARPGAFKGACIAYDYKLQSQFMLLLARDGNHWRARRMPFTRVNEEVSGPDAPWSKAVAHYVQVAALENVEMQKAALRALQLQADNPIPGLAADIQRHFEQPHGSKPYEDLKRLYDLTSNRGFRSRILWAFANGKHAAATELIRGLIKSGEWTQYAGPVGEFVSNLKDSSSVEALLKALEPGNRSLADGGRWDTLWAVSRAADGSNAEGMLALLQSVQGDEVRPILGYFARHPGPKPIAELKRRIGTNYEEHAEMAIAVAAMGDPDIVAWALEDAKKPGETVWVSRYVLASSPLPEADRAAQEILKGSDLSAVTGLLQGYGNSRSPHRIRRLLEGFDLRSREPQLDYWVRYSLRELVREQGDREAEETLKKLPPPPEEKK